MDIAPETKVATQASEADRLKDLLTKFLREVSADPYSEINWKELPSILDSYAKRFAEGQDAIAVLTEQSKDASAKRKPRKGTLTAESIQRAIDSPEMDAVMRNRENV